MGKFCKENWLYILLPVAIVLGVVLYLVMSGSGEGPSTFNGYEL